MTHNTLELARQGDAAAIAVILTYHLSQQSNTTASAIRLGDYLSVLIDAGFDADPKILVNLVLSILRDLKIQGITVVEVHGRSMGDRTVRWNQTIELADLHPPHAIMTPDLLNPELAENSTSPEVSVARPTTQSAPNSDWDGDLKILFQKPEMVALIAFALILVLWDSYLEWMNEVEVTTEPLSGVRLARRLGVSTSTLRRFRERENFDDWSRELDPDGIAWKYENQVFVPK